MAPEVAWKRVGQVPETASDDRLRCEWAGEDSDMWAYHDEEWGVPVHDEQQLFEMLTLE